MKKSKKKSPASRPATQADVRRAKRQATEEATRMCWGIFFRVLIDKYGATEAELKQLWAEIEDYSEAVATGEVTKAEILDSLKQEDNIVIN